MAASRFSLGGFRGQAATAKKILLTEGNKGNVTCFRFFGQMILLFWTAGGELSDVEEQFREAR